MSVVAGALSRALVHWGRAYCPTAGPHRSASLPTGKTVSSPNGAASGGACTEYMGSFSGGLEGYRH